MVILLLYVLNVESLKKKSDPKISPVFGGTLCFISLNTQRS